MGHSPEGLVRRRTRWRRSRSDRNPAFAHLIIIIAVLVEERTPERTATLAAEEGRPLLAVVIVVLHLFLPRPPRGLQLFGLLDALLPALLGEPALQFLLLAFCLLRLLARFTLCIGLLLCGICQRHGLLRSERHASNCRRRRGDGRRLRLGRGLLYLRRRPRQRRGRGVVLLGLRLSLSLLLRLGWYDDAANLRPGLRLALRGRLLNLR